MPLRVRQSLGIEDEEEEEIKEGRKGRKEGWTKTFRLLKYDNIRICRRKKTTEYENNYES